MPIVFILFQREVGEKKLGDIFASEEYSCCSFYILFNLGEKKGHIINDLRKNETLYRPNFKKSIYTSLAMVRHKIYSQKD